MQIETLARDKLGIAKPYQVRVSVPEPMWLRSLHPRGLSVTDQPDRERCCDHRACHRQSRRLARGGADEAAAVDESDVAGVVP